MKERINKRKLKGIERRWKIKRECNSVQKNKRKLRRKVVNEDGRMIEDTTRKKEKKDRRSGKRKNSNKGK